MTEVDAGTGDPTTIMPESHDRSTPSRERETLLAGSPPPVIRGLTAPPIWPILWP